MNVIGSTVPTHAYHVATVTFVCMAGLSFLGLVLLMIVNGSNRASQGIAAPRVWTRIRAALVLAAVTGVLASLPFALAGRTHGVVSFLVRELVYAGVVALCAMGFAAMMAHIATGEFESGDYQPSYVGMSGRSSLFRINPATGLPMNGALDWAGNPYGWNSRSATSHPVVGCVEPG